MGTPKEKLELKGHGTNGTLWSSKAYPELKEDQKTSSSPWELLASIKSSKEFIDIIGSSCVHRN